MVKASTENISFQQTNQSTPEGANHSLKRLFGVTTVALGVLLTLVGVLSLFSSWGIVGGSRYYWAAFLGLPLIVVGSEFTEPKNLTPFEADLNDNRTPRAADQTKHALIMGCQRCHATNPSGANFCNQCGISLQIPTCVSCGATIPSKARFCTHCGKWLV
jgi:ribosomal protein L40E